MNERDRQIIKFALSYLMANLDDAFMANADNLQLRDVDVTKLDEVHSRVCISNEAIAATITDRLFWINGINQRATTLVPKINANSEGGGYLDTEVIREITAVLDQ